MGERARRIRQLRKLGVEPPPCVELEIKGSGRVAFVSDGTYVVNFSKTTRPELRERPLTGEELQAFWPGRRDEER